MAGIIITIAAENSHVLFSVDDKVVSLRWFGVDLLYRSNLLGISKRETNSTKYEKTLDQMQYLLAFGNILVGSEWRFQQDNAIIYNPYSTKHWFSARNVI